MPLLTSLRKLACCAAAEREVAEAPARPLRPEPAHAGPEPAQAGPAPAGRPYRSFVEGELERFLQEPENADSLDETGQQEAGAVALPELPRARRSSPGPLPIPIDSALMAVHVVQMYLVKKGFIKAPYSRLEARPNHVEALIQLAIDANWHPRVFPLPPHPDPQHPEIYYYINDPVSNRPVPTEDSLIRGDYVYHLADSSRIIQDEYIRPWRGPAYQPSVDDICSRGQGAYYTLSFLDTGSWDRSRVISLNEAAITYHWTDPASSFPMVLRKQDKIVLSTPLGSRVLMALYFTPNPR